ncbi:MAG TPA: hypothetical protein VGI19_07350 [Candidatus Cybelea sp.]
MRSLFQWGALGGFLGSMLMLAACSGGSELPAVGGSSLQTLHRNVAPRRSWMAHIDAKMPLVYVSDQQNNAIIVFNAKSGAVVGQIMGNGLDFPQGIFVDEKHNLWVANQLLHDVLVFARGSTTPSETLDDSNGYAMDVTVCRNGTVYVTNNTSLSTGSGNIEVYAGGSTTPTGELIFPNLAYEYFLTCDRKGNIFSTITNLYFTNDVVEFKKGKQSGATDLNIPLNNVGAIKLDAAGNLLIDDQGTNTLTEYTEAGKATGKSIMLTGNVYDFAVTRSGARVGGADLLKGTAYAWSWPGGTQQSVDYVDPNQNPGPFGFAYDPPRKGFGT